jgi:hypothetical protein
MADRRLGVLLNITGGPEAAALGDVTVTTLGGGTAADVEIGAELRAVSDVIGAELI